jgi:hypothetical protein
LTGLQTSPDLIEKYDIHQALVRTTLSVLLFLQTADYF